MNKTLISLVSLIVALTASASSPQGWTTGLVKAFATAKSQKKSVLVEFTGSDWCAPCIAMRKNVFSKEAFVSAASKNFVLVELDIPNGDPAVKARNAPYAEKYKVIAFPTAILFAADGKEISRFNPSDYPTTASFLKQLDASLGKRALK